MNYYEYSWFFLLLFIVAFGFVYFVIFDKESRPESRPRKKHYKGAEEEARS